MKPIAFNQKYYTDYIFVTFKIATPLLLGMALGGCGTLDLHTSFKYLSKLFTDLNETNGIQSEILHRLYIYHFQKYHTPSSGHGIWWVWHLSALYLIYLYHLFIEG